MKSEVYSVFSFALLVIYGGFCELQISLPIDYDSLEVPFHKENEPFRVDANFIAIKPKYINVHKQKIELTFWLTLTWIENRFNVSGDKNVSNQVPKSSFITANYFQFQPKFVKLSKRFDNIWAPELLVYQRYEVFDMDPDLKFVIPKEKNVSFNYFNQAIDISCQMNFTKFPFDVQRCPFSIFATNVMKTEMIFNDVTDYEKSAYLKDVYFTFYKFVTIHPDLPGVGFQMEISRMLTQHIATNYVPSALLVMISWLRYFD